VALRIRMIYNDQIFSDSICCNPFAVLHSSHSVLFSVDGVFSIMASLTTSFGIARSSPTQ
jgi:hypothetical protein